MHTSDIENHQHRNLLEHRRQQVTDVIVVKNSSVVTTNKLSPPSWWLTNLAISAVFLVAVS